MWELSGSSENSTGSSTWLWDIFCIPSNNQEKISSVLKLYNKLNIRDITENEIERYFSKGLQELDLINVATKKKEPLRSFVNQLLGRKY